MCIRDSIWTVAVGVGLFLVIAVLRVLFHIALSRLLLIFYILLFILSFFTPDSFTAVAFDAGGVTTGPMLSLIHIYLVLTEKAVSHEEVDAFQLGVFQLGVTGILNMILAFMIEEPHMPQTPSVWGCVLFLSIFCTGVAFILQPIAQQYTCLLYTSRCV